GNGYSDRQNGGTGFGTLMKGLDENHNITWRINPVHTAAPRWLVERELLPSVHMNKLCRWIFQQTTRMSLGEHCRYWWAALRMFWSLHQTNRIVKRGYRRLSGREGHH